MDVLSVVVDQIRRNRISTTEVADAMSKSGQLWKSMPLQEGYHRVGPVFWARADANSNWWVHHDLQNAPEGCVVVIEARNCGDRAVFGELVAKYLLLYRQVAAIVTNAPVRDANRLRKERWPIWCEGVSPIGVENHAVKEPVDMRFGYDGSIAVCDDSGVVLIPKEELSQSLVSRLQAVEALEDQWFFALDHEKKSTFEIVCGRDSM